MNKVIEISGLHKTLGKNVVLDNINLTIERGRIYGLLGANGAGKTTLMKIMLDLLKPNQGTVKLLGKDIVTESSDILAKVGNIIEAPVFYDTLSVKENLELHCDYINPSYKKDICSVLDKVGLSDTEERKVKELSLGMKQRLAIGRSILCKPDLLILDEPINGLDPKGIVDVRDIIKKLNEQDNMTIVISSHIISEIEKVADTIGILHKGKLVDQLSTSQLNEPDFDLERYFLNILS